MSILAAIVVITISLLSINMLAFNNTYAATTGPSVTTKTTTKIKIPIYMITTRNNQNYPQGVQGPGYNNNYQFSDIHQLLQSCHPTELAIFVHGWGIDEYKAKERLDRVKLSLEYNKYNISLIGFSWDSNGEWEPAKSIAKENGPKLAQFILNYMETCKHEHQKEVKIRLLGHSLGSRVILSTLQSLHENTKWNNGTNNHFKIASVHLMGAAVDDEEVSKNPFDITKDTTNSNTVKSAYGEAIQEEVIIFYNLNNPEDNVLQPLPFYPIDLFYQIYPKFDKDLALGQSGYQRSPNIVLPKNYVQINVQDEIKAIPDTDAIEGWDFGLCNLVGFCKVDIGDNHAGYIGFRNISNTNLLSDDGAINIVVKNWGVS
jgi:pimeloyl-ACP methyl ester carboxylesterase